MSYNKIKAIAEQREVVNLETLKNGKKETRSIPFKDVPMNIVIQGKNTTVSISEIVGLLYNEIEHLKKELEVTRNDTLEKLRKIAEQVDKITNHLNQEGSVVGW